MIRSDSDMGFGTIVFCTKDAVVAGWTGDGCGLGTVEARSFGLHGEVGNIGRTARGVASLYAAHSFREKKKVTWGFSPDRAQRLRI